MTADYRSPHAAITSTMTTYRYANGEPVWGDYAHVGDLDYFDDDDPGSEIVEEVWTLVSRRIGTVHGQMCETCHGEGEITVENDGSNPLRFVSMTGPCPKCDGTGEYDGERITWAPDSGRAAP